MLKGKRAMLLAARQQAKQYRQDEDGSLIMFSLFIFIAMLMFGGIAVDLMLYENRRTHVQNSTDRAVLAAANLNQTVDAKVVVQDYLAKVGIHVAPEDVQVYEIGAMPVVTGRQVSVNVSGGWDTLLMNLVGVESLPYNTTSEAEESVNDVEVSLILDISGSMGSGTKLPDMQDAAKDFLDEILAGSDDNRVSVSLVPYSTQVSAGPELMAQISTTFNHNYSHCVNFDDADFDVTRLQRQTEALDGDGNVIYEQDGDGNPLLDQEGAMIPTMVPIDLEQTAHFDPWRSYGGTSQWSMQLAYPVCRNDAYFDILPWSNNADDLKDQIDLFQAGGNTSIDLAVKWGVALLDPSMRSTLNAIRTDGSSSFTIDPEFSVRPRDFTYEDGLKFVVVMTDGINTTQYELKPSLKTGMSPYTREGDNDILVQWNEPGDRDGDGNSDENWYNVTRKIWKDTPQNPNVQLSMLDMWASMPVSRRAYSYYHRTYDANDYYDNYSRTPQGPLLRVYASDKDDRLNRICSAAKDEGVVIFSIGFEVTDDSAAVMRACASTPNHFYRVGDDVAADDEELLDIDEAFASIANQINQLKLTQ